MDTVKEKKVISKTNIKWHTQSDWHTHIGTHMDTGKMRNKIDMFNVKCRKNHLRYVYSLLLCFVDFDGDVMRVCVWCVCLPDVTGHS